MATAAATTAAALLGLSTNLLSDALPDSWGWAREPWIAVGAFGLAVLLAVVARIWANQPSTATPVPRGDKAALSSITRGQRIADALAEADARRTTRLKAAAVPDEKITALIDWMDGLDEPDLLVPDGHVRALVAPMGAGKTELAHRWFVQGLREAEADPTVEPPVWLNAREITTALKAALGPQSGSAKADARRRIVVDGLDTVSASKSRQLLDDAREIAALRPGSAILLTTRPGLTLTSDELLPVDPWPESRGMEVVDLLTGQQLPTRLLIAEVLEALRSPLLVLAIAARIRAGTSTAGSRFELLSGLASSTIHVHRPDTQDETLWPALMRLAQMVLDSEAPVPEARFGPEPDIWKLTDTGLVTASEGRLSFALPVFEQHFGAQAILTGQQRVDDTAEGDAFPRWRYALAFAIASTPGRAETLLDRVARINPAAASWVLEEIHADSRQREPGTAGPSHPPWRTRADQGHPPAIRLGQWFREAQQAWLDGLGPVGRLLARHGPDGQPVRWGVWLSEDGRYATIAEADAATDEPAVVELAEPWPPIISSGWARIRGVPAPGEPLRRWHWTRDHLREPLQRLVRRRTLPSPPRSPLAHERLWFLAQLIAHGRTDPLHEPIPTQLVRDKVAEMLVRAEGARRTTWHIGGHEIDQDDVRWLHTMLAGTTDVELRRPAPLPDQPDGAPSPSRMYSPQQTTALATDVLQAAVVGYRDLVRTNFPKFGPALGLQSVLPVQIDGIVEISDEAPIGLDASVLYAIRHDPDADPEATPRVELTLRTTSASADLRTELWITNLNRAATRSQKFSYAAVTEADIDMYHARPATDLAYSWLSHDLHAVGWLDRDTPFFN